MCETVESFGYSFGHLKRIVNGRNGCVGQTRFQERRDAREMIIEGSRDAALTRINELYSSTLPEGDFPTL